MNKKEIFRCLVLWLVGFFIGFFLIGPALGQPSSIEDKLNHLFMRLHDLEQLVQKQQEQIDAFRPQLPSTGKLEVVLTEE